jgi:hypothetical protein
MGPIINIQEAYELWKSQSKRTFPVMPEDHFVIPFEDFSMVFIGGMGKYQFDEGSEIIEDVRGVCRFGVWKIESKYGGGVRCYIEKDAWGGDWEKWYFQPKNGIIEYVPSNTGGVYVGFEGDYVNFLAFTLQLLSCKNITYEDYDPNKHIMRQRRRQRERQGFRPFLKYQILHIKPLKARKIKRRSDTDPQRHVAAHRVRGHFKEFSAEHPAFGKPWGVGRFFVADFWSGDINLGLNLSDYHIEIEAEEQG